MSQGPDLPRTRSQYPIGEFLSLVEDLTPDQMADDLFGNRQRTSSRSGILKAEAVQRFASVLRKSGIDDFGDFSESRLKAAEQMIREIPGQRSGISFDYFRMLAGDDNLIKPDRMVQRFIATAVDVKPEQVTPDLARTMLKGAMPVLKERGATWSPRQLDYAIWMKQTGNSGPV